jgi:small conductance mechanosensitive channel
MEINIQDYLPLVYEWGMRILGAVAVLIIGLWIIRRITRGLRKFMNKRNFDSTLVPFLSGIVDITLKILLIISVMSMLGIAMTSFIAILGAVGLAVGMALSGTLQNFAGGVMLLIFKPYKVGDFIEAQGYLGTVNSIQIFNTILLSPDNKTIIIPNGSISTGSMINYSTQEKRRVDIKFGIGYGDDLGKAKSVLLKLIEANDKILKDPAPFLGLVELGDSSVNIASRVWVRSADYWDVYFYLMENVYEVFEKEGLNIPFPQMDVHLHQNN